MWRLTSFCDDDDEDEGDVDKDEVDDEDGDDDNAVHAAVMIIRIWINW